MGDHPKSCGSGWHTRPCAQSMRIPTSWGFYRHFQSVPLSVCGSLMLQKIHHCAHTQKKKKWWLGTLTKWCQENHLPLNIDKTKELVVDFSRQSREHTPITIDKTPVEQVNCFKFLGVHITKDLTWSAHTDAVLKKAHQRLFFLRWLRKFGMSPSILRSFYTCTVESILTGCITAWFGNSPAGNRKARQRVVRTARHIVGGELSSLQDIYTSRCIRKARRIIKDSSHPSHSLISLLPSGRRLRSIRSCTSRLRDSFFPQAIRLMNSKN